MLTKTIKLEQDRRLSQSFLWKLQRRFFEEKGPAAWSDSTVPHYVTNNPFLGHSYARIVQGFARDWLGCLDPDEPVYIIELGAGSGRFAFQFLTALRGLRNAGPPELPPFRYVMTDFAESTLQYWRSHPWLQRLTQEGLVELARFDGVEGGPQLPWDRLKNPVVVVANYFFDSIPQDAFAVRQGKICERLTRIFSSQEEPDLSDPEILGRISVGYSERPAVSEYYDNPCFNRIMRAYLKLDGSEFSFPIAGLRCMERLRSISSGRLLVIAGDHAYSTLPGVAAMRGPMVNVHGSFSITVNYHALGEYFRLHEGEVFHGEDRHAYLNVSAFLLGRPPGGYCATHAAHQDAICGFGPDDFFVLKIGFDSARARLTLRQSLAMLRLSRWDPEIFSTLFAVLLEEIPRSEESDRVQIRHAVQQVWSAYYPIGETSDLPFRAAVLLFECGDFAGALELFSYSIEICGPHATTFYNIALCHVELEQTHLALQALNSALVTDPALEEARQMRERLAGMFSEQTTDKLRGGI